MEKIVLTELMDYQNDASQQKFWGLLSKKLANAATASELQELQSILLSNPNLHHQADLITEMWEQASLGSNALNDAAYMRHVMKHKDEFFNDESHEAPVPFITHEELREEKPVLLRSAFSLKSLWTKPLTIMSFVGLIVVSTTLIYFLSGKKEVVATATQEISSIATKNGNRTKIVLPDGTQVWLNAGSNLDYNNSTFNKELREVSLTGEAYFDVIENEAKPFIIHTKKMDIKVVGTAFNVRSYDDEKIAEASLIRGRIEVTLKDRNQMLVLNPNEKISIPTEEEKPVVSRTEDKAPLKKNSTMVPPILVDKLKTNPTINIIPEIAWTHNMLYFEDASLEELAPMLEKWFGVNVKIQNEALKKLRYRGNYENETIEAVLSSLKLSRSFNYKTENDTVIIY